jgi:serine/threonine protein kinase
MLHQLGDMICDRYQIDRFLGQGGIGITYAAKDLVTGKLVAIKTLSLHQLMNWKTLELFEREAKVLESLDHPAIPHYLDHFQIDLPNDRRFYLVQELAQGNSLADWVKQGGRFSEADVKQMACQVLEILSYLHQLTPPVIHRDIKPQNIVRTPDGTLFLVDFGGVQAAYRNTQAWGSTVVGTFGYMPPEQFQGKAYFASDLYGLGATLLFLLTHRSPADLPQQRLKILFHDKIAVSEGFAEWLERMLEPAVEDRFQSAQVALQALQQTSAVTQKWHFPSGLRRLQKPWRSQVRLQQTNDWLMIEIPPLFRLKPNTVVAHCAATIAASGALFFWSYIFWVVALAPGVGFGSGILLVLLLLVAVELAMIISVISEFSSVCRLEVDRQRFQFDWFQIGLGRFSFRYQHQGRTRDLLLNLENSSIIFWESGKKRGFGQNLSSQEREWLAGEISDFLEKVKA